MTTPQSNRVTRRPILHRFLFIVAGVTTFLLGGITSLYIFQPSALNGISSGSCGVHEASSNVVIPSYLIERAQNRSRTFRDRIQGVEILAHDHPAYQPSAMALEYQPEEEWNTLNFPDISVAGLPKAGTSQLYQILTSHPDLIEFHQRKEFCFSLPHSKTYLEKLQSTDPSALSQLQQTFHHANDHHQPNATNIPSITRWYMLTYGGDNASNNQIPVEQRQRTVNGCHDTVTVLMQRQYLQQRTSPDKLILLLRDPADWLWSAWNFWHHSMDVQPPLESDWAFAPYQYRSPELFHEYLLAGDDRYSPAAQMLQEYRDEMASVASQAVAAAQRYKEGHPDALDILVLKTEDMTPERVVASGFLTKLANFVGVSQDGFNTTLLHSYANCGDNKGTHSQCTKASSAYEITGYRDMLEKSRELVYLLFAEECQLWANELGVMYEDCLEIRKKYHLNS